MQQRQPVHHLIKIVPYLKKNLQPQNNQCQLFKWPIYMYACWHKSMRMTS